ncbi:MAG: thioredoxin domain-containing protein [candidate division KSB1 bacterium]|nr:thioredoxin domain-containing protein [candidate division KSB1 bacterium]
MKINPFKIWSVKMLFLIILVVLMIQCGGKEKETSQDAALAASKETTDSLNSDTSPNPGNETDPIQKQNPARLDKETVALVNNFQITEQYLNQRYQDLPAEYQQEFKNDLEGLLDQLIVRELLFQQAVQKGFAKDVAATYDEQGKDQAIQNYLQKLANQIQVSDAELKSFYNDHISEMRGASYEQVKTNIQNYLVQQKQSELINQTIEQLKTEAKITRNEAWLAKQRALKPPNPLEPALKSGKPTVLDLGAGTCIPCKMMKPIFAELEQSLKGKANVILLEIGEHRDLARQYRVRVIPTQIFFDTKGEVYWRHEGFLPKDEIIKKLQEGGMK